MISAACRSRCLAILLPIAFMTATHRLDADDAVETPSDQGFTRRTLIICGHPGDETHREMFAQSITAIRETLISRFEHTPENVWVLFGGDELAGEAPLIEGVRGDSTQASIAATVAELAAALDSADSLWIITIGHTHYDGRLSWFNLPGPDLNQNTFAEVFADLDCRELVFWITTPASGFYIKPLTGPQRCIISATEADREINETTFPHVLADVLSTFSTMEGDEDGDGAVSLLDLYLNLTRTIAQRYVDDMQLSTEHAQLDDNGDGRGSEIQIDYLSEELGGRASEGIRPPSRPANADGNRAAQILLPILPIVVDDESPSEVAEESAGP